MASKRDTHMRIDRDFLTEVRKTVPGKSDDERFKLIYNTSAVRIESFLKKKDFKDKLGTFLYGNAWKK